MCWRFFSHSNATFRLFSSLLEQARSSSASLRAPLRLREAHRRQEPHGKRPRQTEEREEGQERQEGPVRSHRQH